jgi:hypothetical protein
LDCEFRWRERRGGDWTLTVRAGSKTTRSRFDGLEPALGAVEAQARELVPSRPTRKRYRFEPAEQVIARIELTGPNRAHAGLDIRGDGSQVAFTGRFRRRVVETGEDETAAAALRRVLTAPG